MSHAVARATVPAGSRLPWLPGPRAHPSPRTQLADGLKGRRQQLAPELGALRGGGACSSSRAGCHGTAQRRLRRCQVGGECCQVVLAEVQQQCRERRHDACSTRQAGSRWQAAVRRSGCKGALQQPSSVYGQPHGVNKLIRKLSFRKKLGCIERDEGYSAASMQPGSTTLPASALPRQGGSQPMMAIC